MIASDIGRVPGPAAVPQSVVAPDGAAATTGGRSRSRHARICLLWTLVVLIAISILIITIIVAIITRCRRFSVRAMHAAAASNARDRVCVFAGARLWRQRRKWRKHWWQWECQKQWRWRRIVNSIAIAILVIIFKFVVIVKQQQSFWRCEH